MICKIEFIVVSPEDKMIDKSVIVKGIDQFVEQSGIKVSNQAKVIIGDMLEAISNDPHPNWFRYEINPDDVFQQKVEEIPFLLAQIAEVENVSSVITTWDILHWLNGRLNSICPYRKPPSSNNPQNPVNPLNPLSPFNEGNQTNLNTLLGQ
jgi:hypothetical protein